MRLAPNRPGAPGCSLGRRDGCSGSQAYWPPSNPTQVAGESLSARVVGVVGGFVDPQGPLEVVAGAARSPKSSGTLPRLLASRATVGWSGPKGHRRAS